MIIKLSSNLQSAGRTNLFLSQTFICTLQVQKMAARKNSAILIIFNLLQAYHTTDSKQNYISLNYLF